MGCGSNSDRLEYHSASSTHSVMTMNRTRLQELAKQEGIRDDAYSLDGGLPSERYVLEVAEGGWHVYYSERGLRTGLQTFDTEAEACEHLFEMLLADPTTREDYGGVGSVDR
jgi:hypothetical protein